jgi:hypothetical protein
MEAFSAFWMLLEEMFMLIFCLLSSGEVDGFTTTS